MTTALRLATEADAGRIAELHAESWRRTYRGMLRDDFLDGKVVENRLAVWRERLSSPRPNQHVAVAESAGELDGFICAFGDEDPRWGTLIDNLHVRHRLHKSGIGRSLMRETAGWALSRYPEHGVYLWVMAGNINAQEFYAHLGGSNEGMEVREHADGASSGVFRIAWPDPRILLA